MLIHQYQHSRPESESISHSPSSSKPLSRTKNILTSIALSASVILGSHAHAQSDTAPLQEKGASASLLKTRASTYSPQDYERIISLRVRADALYHAYVQQESRENLQALHSVFIEWRNLDMLNLGYNKNGLADRIRSILLHNGYSRLPPV
jgi:hypothetical protein